MGAILGARVLGKFGDDPDRCADGKGRRNRSRREATPWNVLSITFLCAALQ